MTTPCCETMRGQLEHQCPQHGTDCPDQVVRYGPVQERWFLVAENASYDFTFCPWCGSRFQEPLPSEPTPVQVTTPVISKCYGCQTLIPNGSPATFIEGVGIFCTTCKSTP